MNEKEFGGECSTHEEMKNAALLSLVWSLFAHPLGVF
jgi:hypothetical protein